MAKILLERKEFDRIADILQHYKGINHCEIEVESVGGIGKVTTLYIPHTDFVDGGNKNINGVFAITITDENDW